MLKLNDINLIRTSSFYRSDTLKAAVSRWATAPLKTLTESKKTDFFLKNISLQISAGERIALLGKNGSGKSSLCRIIAGQLFGSSGHLSNPFKTSLFSEIENCFFSELSGRENLSYFVRFLYGDLGANEQENLILQAIEFSELGPAIDKQVETYSSGMISRLALSLILCKQHDLLILDEMRSNADQGFRKKVALRLTDVINSSNTVIIVSHHMEEIRDICSRGIVIEGGRIIFDGNIQKAIACYMLSAGEVRE